MTAQVVNFDGVTSLDLPVGRILEQAKQADLSAVIVLGFTEDGDVFFAASNADGGDVMWLMERTKRALLDYAESE